MDGLPHSFNVLILHVDLSIKVVQFLKCQLKTHKTRKRKFYLVFLRFTPRTISKISKHVDASTVSRGGKTNFASTRE